MIEMTLSSRHRIRNSSPGSLRPSTLPLGDRGNFYIKLLQLYLIWDERFFGAGYIRMFRINNRRKHFRLIRGPIFKLLQ